MAMPRMSSSQSIVQEPRTCFIEKVLQVFVRAISKPMIPMIEILTATTVIVPPSSIPCAVCGELVAGNRLAVGRNAPKWVKSTHLWWSNLKWRLWAFWEIHRGRPVTIRCHDICIPDGWKSWTIEVAQDLVAIHSLEAEEELIDILTKETHGTL